MTDEMLELARRNQREAGVENVEFLKGTIEEVPLPDDSVDVVISNCVINLSADKPAVFREAARVLRPGGRFAVTDIVADPGMDEETRRDMAQWTGCIAGALTQEEFRRELEAAGFEEVEIRETHRVHDQAGSAIIRRPGTRLACRATREYEVSRSLARASPRSRQERISFDSAADGDDPAGRLLLQRLRRLLFRALQRDAAVRAARRLRRTSAPTASRTAGSPRSVRSGPHRRARARVDLCCSATWSSTAPSSTHSLRYAK